MDAKNNSFHFLAFFKDNHLVNMAWRLKSAGVLTFEL